MEFVRLLSEVVEVIEVLPLQHYQLKDQVRVQLKTYTPAIQLLLHSYLQPVSAQPQHFLYSSSSSVTQAPSSIVLETCVRPSPLIESTSISNAVVGRVPMD